MSAPAYSLVACHPAATVWVKMAPVKENYERKDPAQTALASDTNRSYAVEDIKAERIPLFLPF
jgi:hypothetical protein